MKKLVLFFAVVMVTLNMVAQNSVAKEVFPNKTLADMEAEFKKWEYPSFVKAAMLKSSDFCIVSMPLGGMPYSFVITYQTKDNKVVRLWVKSSQYSEIIEAQSGDYSLYVSGVQMKLYQLPTERSIPIASVDDWGNISVNGSFSCEKL